MDPRARRLIRRIGVPVAAILSVHSAAVAETHMEERDGVLYVWNVVPSQAAVGQSAASQMMRSVARPPAPYDTLIHAAATRHGLAPALVEAVGRAESNFDSHAGSKQ